MAKFLRPRRGSKDSAFAQQMQLKKGELFLEFPNSEIGRGPGRLVVGDGATSYQNINYATTATNVFRPFITDPEIYVPRFNNSTYATSGWTVDAGTEAINAMGDGSSASTVALPTLLGNIKNVLCKHANSIIKINNDVANKADKTVFSVSAEGLVPKPTNATTANFLRGDGTWVAGNSLANTESDGLVRKLNPTGQETRFLRGDNTWATPPDTKYNLVSAESAGLVRKLYNDASTATRFLRGNNTWAEINDVFPGVLPCTNDYTASTSAYFTGTGAHSLYRLLNNNLLSVSWVPLTIPYNTTDKRFSTVTANLHSGSYAKAGYIPIAVAGFNTGSDDLYPNTVVIQNPSSGYELYVAVHNVSEHTSTATSGGCNILWMREPVS